MSSDQIRMISVMAQLGVMLLFLLPAPPLQGQPAFTTTAYTLQDGLPTANVRDVVQDSLGFIWLGSEEGLIRFDGQSFMTVPTVGRARYGLSDNVAHILANDRRGRFWVITRRAIHRYEPDTRRFRQYPFSDTAAGGPGGQWGRRIYETRSGDLWLLTDAGMNLYDEMQDRFHFFPAPGNLRFKEAYGDYAEVDGGLWFVNSSFLCRLDLRDRSYRISKATQIDPTLDPSTELHTVIYSSPHHILLATDYAIHRLDVRTGSAELLHRFDERFKFYTRTGQSVFIEFPGFRLHRLDPATGVIEPTPFLPPTLMHTLRARHGEKARRGPDDRYLADFDLDASGAAHLLFPGVGLAHYEPWSGNLQLIDTTLLRTTEYSGFLEDRDGTFWFGVPGRGLLHVEFHRQRFTTPPLLFEVGTPYRPEWRRNIRSVVEWNHDTIVVASLAGLYLHSRGRQRSLPLEGLPRELAFLGSAAMWSVERDAQGRLWIGTNANGLVVLDPRSMRYRILTGANTPHDFVDKHRVRTLRRAPGGHMIIGTWDGLFTCRTDSLDLASARPVFVRRIPLAFDGAQRGSRFVLAAAVDRKGRPWIGTDHGLHLFRSDFSRLHTWLRDSTRTDGLRSDDIRCITEDRDGRIWIGTHGGGLHRFHPEDGSADVFDMTSGLPSNIIYSIEQDRGGDLWLGTHHGLCRFDPGTGRVRIYRERDGLQNFEFNTGASAILSDGRMVFGGVAGFNVFDPDSVRDLLSTPPVAVTRISVFDDEFPYSSGEIRLTHDRNTLTFEFAALSFSANDETRYAYRLEGLDGDWIQSGSRRFASYSNLDPGRYVFRVIACNSEGAWNTVGAAIPFVITPAWYESPFAYGLYLLCGIGVILLIVRVQQRRVIRAERVRSEITEAQLRAHAAEAQAKALSTENELKQLELERARQLRKAYQEVEKFSRVVHQSPAIVMITDTSGALEYVNPKFCEVTGYAEEEVLGKNPRMLKSDENPASLYRDLWSALSEGREWRGELKNRRRDGTPYWVLSSISPLKSLDGEITHYIGIQEDITARKETEHTLARRTEELETIDRIVKILNAKFDFGHLIDSLLAQGMELLPGADRACIYIREAASPRYVLADAIGYDETAAPEAEIRPGDAVRGYRLASEIPESAIQVYTRDGNTAERDGGLASAPSLLLMRVRIDGEHEEWDSYLLFTSRSATDAFSDADAQRLVRYREHAVTALAKVHTLRALQQKNEELVRTQEQLVVQQKLASLGQLTAGIAHEIRNPLNFINNFALTAKELAGEIQHALDTGGTVTDLLAELSLSSEKIHEHGSRANRIVEGMLLHARSRPGEQQDTAINRLVQDALNLAYHGMRASVPDFDVRIETAFDDAAGSLLVETQEISRVILSVLDNALYAVRKRQQELPPGDPYAPVIRVRTARRDGAVEIRVWDNGGGIPEDVRARMFEPFYTTKPAGEGTGLGLSLSHDIIVKGHRGSMEVESDEGDWTEIIIRLEAGN